MTYKKPTRRVALGWGATFIAASSLLSFTARAASGQVITLVGTGVMGSASDGESVATAKINQPYGVLVAPDGKLYWADFGTDRVLRYDFQTRRVAVVAGNGVKGHAGDGDNAKSAQMAAPHEVRFDSKGNMLVAERDANVVRHVDMKTGVISTLVGTGVAGFSGDGGPSELAQLHQPHSIALDSKDNLYICDILNHRVRRRDAVTGVITTFGGDGSQGVTPDEAPLIGTPLRGPRSIDIGPDGTLYLILREGNEVFAINPVKQTLKRLAGTGAKGYSGDGGSGLSATFNGPKGIVYASDDSLYISDTENQAVRRLDLKTGLLTTILGTGKRGDGPEGAALGCSLTGPHGLCIHDRTLYVGDAENYRIRALTI